MKSKKLWFPILLISWGILCGASLSSTATKDIPFESKTEYNSPPEGVEAQVHPGSVMMSVTKGDFFTAYELKETVTGSVFGNKCVVHPQTFGNVTEKGKYFYAVGKDLFQPFALNTLQGADQMPCGLKFSKKDLTVDETVVQYPDGEFDEMGFDGKKPPKLEPVLMVNIYGETFLRKTLKFDSYSDGFLALRYMEERGTPNGYNQQGVWINTPPTVTEQMYEYDIEISRIIEVQGAQIEIIEASQDLLVYKVVRKMSPQ